MPDTRIDHITGGIYRIATMSEDYGITFNQFLIDDERPTLIHTGMYPAYENVRNGVAQVLDPAKLAYVVLLHFESDECGGMYGFVGEAPESELVGSDFSINGNLRGWMYSGRLLGVRDGDDLDLGRHKLHFLETPHVHHWDSMMVFEETTRSFFPADLFIQPGDQPPIVTENLSAEMCALYREVGIFAHEEPVRQVVERIEALDPDWMHAMHGGTLAREAIPKFAKALHEQPFGFEGKLLGRELPVGPRAVA
jgi:flavorubredoxin